MDSCPSIQKRSLKSFLRSKLELKGQDADDLVNQYRVIKDACCQLAGKVYSKNLDTSLFETQIFNQYPGLSAEIKKDWVKESMMAQFR